MSDDFLDPYKYGKLVAMAERSKGSLWAIMGAASVFGGFVTWLVELLFKK